MEKIKYLNDNVKPTDKEKIIYDGSTRVNSKLEFYNDVTGEQIYEPLFNKTVIAGSALTAMKLFNLDRNTLDNTPTYDTALGLNESLGDSAYPSKIITDTDGNVIGTTPDESQRKILGFCLGQGGAGLDISDVFAVKYCSWIEPDNLVPFKYPLQSADNVDESMYKGKKSLVLTNGQQRNAYYFKAFSNTPVCVQGYTSTIGTFNDAITAANVYSNRANADSAQTYVELHLKVTKDDCREFFIAHTGLENAKVNQISLVSGWERDVEVDKLDEDGNSRSATYSYFTQVRPFSLINIPSEILSDKEKSISIIYTLYF